MEENDQESSEKPATQEDTIVEEVEPEVEGEGEGLEDKDEEGQRKDSGLEAPPVANNKKIINQFNFCERATLSINYPSRVIIFNSENKSKYWIYITLHNSYIIIYL